MSDPCGYLHDEVSATLIWGNGAFLPDLDNLSNRLLRNYGEQERSATMNGRRTDGHFEFSGCQCYEEDIGRSELETRTTAPGSENQLSKSVCPRTLTNQSYSISARFYEF